MKCITCFFVVLTIKTVFKGVAGGIVIFSAFELLRRGSTYDQLVTAINNCVLPASAKLIQMAEGALISKFRWRIVLLLTVYGECTRMAH